MDFDCMCMGSWKQGVRGTYSAIADEPLNPKTKRRIRSSYFSGRPASVSFLSNKSGCRLYFEICWKVMQL
jgi:hypothetical protein